MKTPRGESAVQTLVFFIFFLLALGMLWVASGGPSHAGSHSGPFLSAPIIPRVDLGYGSTTPEQSGGGQQTNSYLPENGSTNYSQTAGDSPYANDIQFSATNATSPDPRAEYLTLYTASNTAHSITLTGWSVESTANNVRIPIGEAAQLPRMGQINSVTPFTVGPNSTIYISSGYSQTGTSFRTNECTGYFEQFQDFTPQLQIECPSPWAEASLRPEITSDNGECGNFISTIKTCELFAGTPPSQIGSACQSFVQSDLTYNGCINKHQNDPDFYKNEWRIFLNRTQGSWNDSHDQIRLLDENGKVVASVSY